MSKHFDLFDSADTYAYTAQVRFTSRTRAGTGRSALRLAGAGRVELERIVARIYLSPGSPKPQILVFLGAELENGSHSTCVYSSDLLAACVPGPVCLVEVNPNVVSLRERLGIPDCRGLTDLLANSDLNVENVVTQVPGGDLWLLTSGFPLPAGELPSYSARLLDRMNELRRCFDFILLDAPPDTLSHDALMLAQLADGAVLILPTSGGRRGPARRLREELDDAGVTVFGVILTDRNFSLLGENQG